MTDKRLFLIDAMAMIYRSFYALQRNPRITSYGLDSSASFGFTNFLLDLINKEQPTHIAVCTDPSGPTFRHEQFEEYKANRSKMPENIASNLPIIEEILQGFQIPLISYEGYEADDVIGTIAKQAEKEGFKVFMVTPDKDFGQLISENIKIYKPGYAKTPSEVIDKETLCEKYNIKEPKQLIDYLGLVGDSADNIPGVKGVGPVAAKKILSQYGDLETALQNIEKIKNKSIKIKLEEGKENAILSKKLATIITDVPCVCDFNSFELKEIKYEKVKDIFEKLEFRSIIKRIITKNSTDQQDTDKQTVTNNNDLDFGLFATQKTTKKEETQTTEIVETNNENIEIAYDNINTTTHNYIEIKTEDDINYLITRLKETSEFAFDTETTNLNANDCEIVAISFCINKNEAFFLLFDEDQEKTKQLLQRFKPIFEDEQKLIIGQNIKYDILVLKWYDLEVKGKLFDTMIAHYIIAPESRHNMDNLSMKYLNYIPVSIETLIGKKGPKQRSMREVDIELLKQYAAEDADITYQLYLKLKDELTNSGNESLFYNIEMPLIKVLVEMEFEGVRLDTKILADYANILNKQIKDLETTIYELAGKNFNINSPKQLGEILFDELSISSKPKKTKSGQYATGEEVLVKLRYAHPIIEKILEYRSLSKLVSTYIEPLPLLINPKTKKIHTSYQQAVVATGRLSSINPNLQNIPIRTGAGKEIRKAFTASDNEHILIAADYSQIELRIIAHIANDKKMLVAFQQGKDIHSSTAAAIFNKHEEDITPEDRRMAKTVNFGIIYGISAFGLSQRLQVSRLQSANIIEEYFNKYPNIKIYMEEIVKKAETKGYVETILGRRRYIKDIDSHNAILKKAAERNAINAPIQGSSADMIKLAMINIAKAFQTKKIKSKMILQVHDELIFDTYIDELELVKTIIDTEMRNAIKLSLPIEVSIGQGDNWLEAH